MQVWNPNFEFRVFIRTKKDAPIEERNSTLLALCILQLKLPFLQVILNHKKLIYNKKDENGSNTIWHAAMTQDIEVFDFLLNFRAPKKSNKCLFDPTQQD